jgi:succinate dehydrogenase/fumarate reductase iron-sulfur protein
MSDMQITIRIRTWSDDGRRHLGEYLVPEAEGMSVLNALEYVCEHLDSTIAYRSSCRRGVCGGCAMKINGKRRLACETLIQDGMEIDPFDEEWGER